MENYNAPGSRAPATKSLTYALMVLITVAVALRFYARKFGKEGRLWWDDWFALLGWVFAMAFYPLYFPMASIGFGQHIGHVKGTSIPTILLYIYVGEIVYNVCLTFIKLSALMFYVRIFGMKKLWFKCAVWFVGFCIVGWGIQTTFLGSFQCDPPRKAWKLATPGHCVGTKKIYTSTAITNVIIDFFILFMPLPLLKGLQMSSQRKVGVAIVFALGYSMPAISIVRTVDILSLSTEKLLDITWYFNTSVVIVGVEVGVGLISICLPALISLINQVAKRVPKLSSFSFISSRRLSSMQSSRDDVRYQSVPAMANTIQPGGRPGLASPDSGNSGSAFRSSQGSSQTLVWREDATKQKAFGMPDSTTDTRREYRYDAILPMPPSARISWNEEKMGFSSYV